MIVVGLGAVARGAISPTLAPASPAPSNPVTGSGSSSLPSAPGPIEIALLVVALGVLGAGLLLMVRARKTPPGAVCDPPLPLLGAVRRSSVLTMAVCVIVLGYHMAAWTVPAWLPLHIPGGQWWILALAVALAVAGTVLAERVEAEPRG